MRTRRTLFAAIVRVGGVGATAAHNAALYDPSQLPAIKGQAEQYSLTPRGDVDGATFCWRMDRLAGFRHTRPSGWRPCSGRESRSCCAAMAFPPRLAPPSPSWRSAPRHTVRTCSHLIRISLARLASRRRTIVQDADSEGRNERGPAHYRIPCDLDHGADRGGPHRYPHLVAYRRPAHHAGR